MKKGWAIVAIVLLLAADALLKIYVEHSPLFAPSYSSTFRIATVVLILSALYLFQHLRRGEAASSLWQSYLSDEKVPKASIFVILIILSGAFVRFWKLDSLFVGFFLDEAYNGLDAIAIRELGARPIFLAWNSGREALVAYLDAASTWLFGYSAFAIRAVTALAGTLTLVCFYFFAKKVFSQKIALIAVFLLAFSKYAIIYNRFGLRINLMLLFEVASLCFLAYGMKSEKKNYLFFIAAGIAAGLGFHTYIPYRIFPLVLIAFLLDKGIRSHLRAHLKGLAAAIIVCLLVAAPLAYHFVKNPKDFSGRMKKTGVLSNQKESPVRLIWRSTKDTVGLFVFKSDPNPRHNVEEEPGLSPFSTGFFVLGALIALVHIRHPYSFFLLFYFFITILPGILGAAAPHASRNLGALPPALLFSTFGILAVVKIVAANRILATTLLAVILAGNLFTGINDGLFRYASILDSQTPDQTSLWGMDSTETEIADYLNRLGDHYDVYIAPQHYFHATIEYLTYDKSKHQPLTDHVQFPRTKQTLVLLQLTRRNMWWMRDDDNKNFYHWWNQYRQMEIPYIRSMIRRAYIKDPHMMKASDRYLLQKLQILYPEGKLLDFDQFSVYLFK
jgi:4-amino-4-deoxy-L-arabinose transferase-like glycosyltransferase